MEDQLESLVNENGCPKCNSQNVNKVGYTWWGGVIGPRLMNHTKCKDCSYTFNSKTRASNTNKIIIYSVVLLVIGIGIILLLKG